MKFAFALGLFACALCSGQTASDCKPSSLNIPGAPYPCIYSDNRVAFRVSAPDAQKVQVRLGGTHDMTRGADGLWTVTDRKSTRLNSSHPSISYAVFCL